MFPRFLLLTCCLHIARAEHKCQEIPLPSNSMNITYSPNREINGVATIECALGFEPSGTSPRICRKPNGTMAWEGPLLACEAVCPEESPGEGMDVITYTLNRHVGSVATVTCQPGYAPVRDNDSPWSCMAAGDAAYWVGTRPTCDAPQYATDLVYSNEQWAESIVTVNCKPTYSPDNDPASTPYTCDNMTAEWIGTPPTCVIAPLECPTIPVPENGKYMTYNPRRDVDGVATVTCDYGFNAVHDYENPRMCTSDGENMVWVGISPTCQAAIWYECPEVSPGEFATSVVYTPGNRYIDSVASFVCQSGYAPISDTVTPYICTPGSPAAWQGTAPSCMAVCPIVDVPPNGVSISYTMEQIDGSEASVICATTFGPAPNDDEPYRCDAASAEWIGKPLACISTECPMLAESTTGTISYSADQLLGSVARLTCHSGAELQGNDTAVCETMNKPGMGVRLQWTQPIGACSDDICPDVPFMEGRIVQYSVDTTEASVASISCDLGYDISGFGTTLMCNTGAWDDSPASCYLIQCDDIILPTPTGSTNDLAVTYSSDPHYYLTHATIGCLTIDHYVIGDCSIRCYHDLNWVEWWDKSPMTPPTTCGAVTCEAIPTEGTTSIIYDFSLSNDPDTSDSVYYPNVTAVVECQDGFRTKLFNKTTQTVTCKRRYCSDAGQWYYDSCTQLVCPDIPDIPNGALTFEPPDSKAVGAVVTLTCNPSFRVVGNAVATCLTDEQWSGSPPSCESIPVCPQFDVQDGNVVYNDSARYEGTQATVTCNDEFLLSGNSVIACLSNKAWETQPNCTEIPRCTDITITSGNRQYSDASRITGTVAAISCEIGYELIGPESIACDESVSWQPSPPVCRAIPVCPIVSLSNGGVQYDDTNRYRDANASITCNPEHQLEGPSKVNCRPTQVVGIGAWDPPELPACTAIPTCTDITINNGNKQYNDTNRYSGTFATLSCNTNYELVSPELIVCDQNVEWQPPPPYCRAIPICPPISLNDGNIAYDDANRYRGANASISCDTGFQLEGLSRVVCQPTGDIGLGAWEPSTVSVCSAIPPCPLLPLIANGLVTYEDPLRLNATRADITCNDHFILEGSTSLMCQAPNWSDPVPECTETGCIWSSWAQWSRCSAPCGVASKSRSRFIVVKRADCYLYDESESAECNNEKCAESYKRCEEDTTADELCLKNMNLNETYPRAKAFCIEKGGTLPVIKSKQLENSFYDYWTHVISSPDPSTGPWIGLENIGGIWKLPDFTKALYFRWSEQQPDTKGHDCVTHQFDNGGFNDWNCDAKLPVICQFGDENFKIVAAPPEFPMSELEKEIAEVGQTINCIYLLVILGSTLILTLLVRDRSFEAIIHINQDISLIIAHLVIMFFRDSVENESVCKIASLVLQYCFTVMFLFCLLEALQFYAVLTTMINSNGFLSSRMYVTLTGWLCPLPLVALSGIFHGRMTSYWSCWLNLGDNVMLITVLPVSILTCVAFIVTEASGIDSCKKFPVTNPYQLIAARINQSAMLILLPAHWFSWFLGLFAIYNQRIQLYGLFFIANVLLGVLICVFHMFGNPEVQRLLKKLYRKLRRPH